MVPGLLESGSLLLLLAVGVVSSHPCKGDLQQLEEFAVLTDHKNLKYFAKPQRLGERQVRWSEYLGEFNMEMVYKPANHPD